MLKPTAEGYLIGGLSALALAEYFAAPLYVYDVGKMESQYKHLKGAFKEVKLKINHAYKALNNSNVLRFLYGLGAGLDTVSIRGLESGGFLVSESDTFIGKVNALKQTTVEVFAQVDSGMNHFICPMFDDSYQDIENISKPQSRLRVYSTVGYICETDTFALDR